jgi:hypothetical protein
MMSWGKKIVNEDNYDMDYQWLSYIRNGFWLEHM